MIELKNDKLVFSFPEVHPKAELSISLQRTLRIPDDGSDYPLPPGLGEFPMRHVDDYAATVADSWLKHGGVMMPMYQSEAMWLNFSGPYLSDREIENYPFAIKIATGKINAISGDLWVDDLHANPQDYIVHPDQPWLDGYQIENGIIRQFVAMPLGDGYSAEEQLTDKAEFGGLQIIAYPMKRETFEKMFPKKPQPMILYQACGVADPEEMGLAPGGRMEQEIYEDPYGIDCWDRNNSSRCFVHICNSQTWRAVTGENPPHLPFTAEEYTKRGFPWFDYFDNETKSLDGSKELKGLKSVTQLGKEKGEEPLNENQTVDIHNIQAIHKNNVIREGEF